MIAASPGEKPGATPLKPGSCAKPLPGVKFELVDAEGRVLDGATNGNLCITDSIGRRTRTTYTVDYLVVDEQRACAYEIKSDEELEKLVRERPSDWQKHRG